MESGSPTTVLGSIDSPVDGSIVTTRSLTVAGWSLAPGSRVRSVVVLLDGVAVAAAPTGLPRPDLPAQFPLPGAHEAGFSCVVDLAAAAGAGTAAPATSTLAVAAILEDGSLSSAFARATLLRPSGAAGRPACTLEGNIDWPEVGTRVAPGLLRVEGWAAYGRRPVREVFVQAKGCGFVTASARPRPDVAEHYGVPALADAGFLAEVDLRHVAGGPDQEVSVEVAVLLDEAEGGGPPGPAVHPLGTVSVVVGGSLGAGAEMEAVLDGEVAGHLLRPAPLVVAPAAHPAVNRFETTVARAAGRGAPAGEEAPEAPPAAPSPALQEARSLTDLGLPVPRGVRFRFAKRLFTRACWPFLRHQVAFNRALLAELALRDEQAREARVALGSRLDEVHVALRQLAGDLRAALDRQLADTNTLLREQGVVQRYQLDLVRRQGFERHHEELANLRSELTEMAMLIGDVRAVVEPVGDDASLPAVVLEVSAALEPTNGKGDAESRAEIEAGPGASR